jgi:hypothetical protein
LVELLAGDAHLQGYLSADQIRAVMQAGGYTGFAAQRARALAEQIRARQMDGNY